MKKWIGRALLAAALALQAGACSADVGGDERILEARKAFQAGDWGRIDRLAVPVTPHVLEPYVEYWAMAGRLADTEPQRVADFLARQRGTYLAARLRADWLRHLAESGQWERFEAEYPRLELPDPQLRCHALAGRWYRGDATALKDARALWLEPELPDTCWPLFEALVGAGRVDADDLWQRMRRLIEARRFPAARQLATLMPASARPDRKTLDAVATNPRRYLERLKPRFAASRVGREMAMAAVVRLARSDAEAAVKRWESMDHRFSAAERRYVAVQLAWQLALDHHPRAEKWFRAAGEAPLSEEQRAWRVRAGLRTQHWRFVRESIEDMPLAQRSLPEWTYWLGRAYAATGRDEDARVQFERLSGQPTFYGNLADDELGRPVSVPEAALPPLADELADVGQDPGLRRALALFRLDMRIEGIREWNWALRNSDDRRLLAAAELAQGHDLFDRAIYAAERTVTEHAYEVRYLAPFKEQVAVRAAEQSLDPAWVFGLMRQESRFVLGAKSSAGAQGLMQIMPATARWVARKIGMTDFRPDRVGEMDTNVLLGTSYLRMVYESLDRHPVLASAAYNAGPRRARQWRDSKPLEGAIYAETIPFNETRDYVKKVMSNAVYYSVLFNGQPASLKALLGTVYPAGEGGSQVAEELP